MATDPTRDALGLVRLLYALERETEDLNRRAALHDIGLALHHPGPRAVAALERLAGMGWEGGVGLLVAAALERVRRGPKDVEDPRAGKREGRVRRGG